MMNYKAIILTLFILLTVTLSPACTTTTEQAPTAQAQQEREVIETPYIVPGIGVGGFSGPGFGGPGGFFGGGIGIYEEEEG